jgi:hypothetical protein
MPKQESDIIGIPIAWIGMDEAEIAFANQIIFQMGDPEHLGEFTLTFGQLHSPAMIGPSPEDNRKRLEALPYVPVRVVAKVALSEVRVRELVDILVRVLKSYDDLKPRVEREIARAKQQAVRRKRA